MKTAVEQAIENVHSSTKCNYSIIEVLTILNEARIIQDTQIKIAYLHGGIAVLEKSDVKSDEYFENQFNNSL